MIGNLKADDQQAVFEEKHNFKRGLIDKWCISNASLDNHFWLVNLLKLLC